MARIVLGLGTSHSPQLSVPWSSWSVLREKDETDERLDYAALLARAKPNIADELTPEKWEARDAPPHQAIAAPGGVRRRAGAGATVGSGGAPHRQVLDGHPP